MIITISSIFFFIKLCWELLFLDSYFYDCNFNIVFRTLQCSAYIRKTYTTTITTSRSLLLLSH